MALRTSKSGRILGLILLVLYRDKGKEAGNYHIIKGYIYIYIYILGL